MRRQELWFSEWGEAKHGAKPLKSRFLKNCVTLGFWRLYFALTFE